MMLGRMFRRGMSCSQALEVLQGYLDGEVDENVARKVAAHLDRCAVCENEGTVYREIKGSLSRQRRGIDPEVATALARFGERVARGEAS